MWLFTEQQYTQTILCVAVKTIGEGGDGTCETEAREVPVLFLAVHLDSTQSAQWLRYTLHDRGIVFLFQQENIFYLPHIYQTWSGEHTTSPKIGNWGSFPGSRRPRCEADHKSSTKLKNVWIYASTPLCISMTRFLISRRHNFASFTLLNQYRSFFKDLYLVWGHHGCPKSIKFLFTLISFPPRCISSLLPPSSFLCIFSSFPLDKLAASPLFPWRIKDRSDLSCEVVVWRGSGVVR